MPKPNFFIVGAPKCGTTALYEYLNQHPEIFMCPLKEPYFFGSDFQGAVSKQFQMTLDEYLALFNGVTHQKRIGEASPSYLSSQKAALEIYTFQPEAKIIIMLRNPVDMLHSMYYHRRFTGDEANETFEAAMLLELEHNSLRPGFIPYFSLTNYAESVKRYFDIFEKNNVMVTIFDDFRDQLLITYRNVLDFLEVNSDFQPSLEIVNASKRVRSPLLERTLRRLGLTPKQVKTSPIYNLATRFLPPNLYQPLINTAIKLYARPAEKMQMSSDIRRRLQFYFQPEIDLLSELLDRDLRHWYVPEQPIPPP